MAKQPRGAPSTYSEEMANFVCDTVATHIEGLRWLHKNVPNFPAPETIWKWKYAHEDFRKRYAESYKHKMSIMAEDIIELSRNSKELCKFQDEKGVMRTDAGAVAATRLEIDTKKWAATKILPGIYGDVIQNHVTINDHESWLKESLLKAKNEDKL